MTSPTPIASTPQSPWHSYLGHPAAPILSNVLSIYTPSIAVSSINKMLDHCVHCHMAKSHQLPYCLPDSHASNPLELLHLDVWGPTPCPSTSGARYFLIIGDDFSRYARVYFLPTKDQILHSFIHFHTLVEKQLKTSIKCIQSDNGGEFLAFASYLHNHGILHRFSCPYTPQQNGRVERKIRHLVEMGMALLSQASVPSKFWMQAFQTAAYLINILPSKILHFQPPMQLLFNKAPNYHHLNIFGCLCFPSLSPDMIHKLSYKSIPCVFLGEAPAHKGYVCLDLVEQNGQKT